MEEFWHGEAYLEYRAIGNAWFWGELDDRQAIAAIDQVDLHYQPGLRGMQRRQAVVRHIFAGRLNKLAGRRVS